MHTYSGITPQEYYDAIRAGNLIHFEMYFSDQGVTITEENINISYGVTITDIINGDNELSVGKAVCQQFQARIILNDDLRYIKWKDRFRVRFGVEINGDTKWITVGYYNGVKPKNVQTETEIDYVAYDDVIKYETHVDEFLETLNYPIDTFDLGRAIGSYFDVTLSDVPGNTGTAFDWVTGTTFTKKQLSRYKTIREMLSAIAEATCTYIKMHSTTGTICHFEWFGDEQHNYGQPGYNDFPIIRRTDQFLNDHADLYNGLTWNELELRKWNVIESQPWDNWDGNYRFTNKIDSFRLVNDEFAENSIYYARLPGYNNYYRIYSVEENLFTKDCFRSPNDYATAYVTKLGDFGGQLPMLVECTGNWCIEAGDYVDVEIEQGEVVHMPVYMHTLHYNGGITSTLETTGESFGRYEKS